MNKKIKSKFYIIVILFCLYICLEIILSNIPFVDNLPAIVKCVFQKPSDKSILYLVFNILKSLFIGVLGAVIYDIVMIQMPKTNNKMKHSMLLNNIVYNIENIISVYLLTNNYNTDFSNLNRDKLKETKLCLTNEAIYYKDLHSDFCDKSYIFNTYKKCVNEIIESANKILVSKYPIREKYEEKIDELMKNDLIQLIAQKKYPDATSKEYPFQPSMSKAFKFNFNQILALYDIYLNISSLIEKNYELPVYGRVDKSVYLDSFYNGMLFYSEQLIEKEFNLSFIEDAKDEVLLLKHSNSIKDKEKYDNFFYYLYAITKVVDEIYYDIVIYENFNAELLLKTWIDLLKHCISILNNEEILNKTFMILPLYLFKQHLKLYNNEDEKFLKEFFNSNIGYFDSNLEEKFAYYVLIYEKNKAKEIYESANESFKKEITKSPYWKSYLNL